LREELFAADRAVLGAYAFALVDRRDRNPQIVSRPFARSPAKMRRYLDAEATPFERSGVLIL
jgi:hypothetical protein